MTEVLGKGAGFLGDFARVGRTLFEAGLNTTHSGNMSMRVDGEILITRHGAMLGTLHARDLVLVGLRAGGVREDEASWELPVHRAVYTATDRGAVIHSHPRSATALSLVTDIIEPADLEGRHYLGSVPVVDAGAAAGSVPDVLAGLLESNPVVVARGHGAFAAAADLYEALKMTHALEWSCDILLRSRSGGFSGPYGRDGGSAG